ncbi:MAG: ATP-binding protein [Lachnospiraceae bacterium]|nr:ATP-binding protein [Lachnospiraceae bacterium]
MKEVNLPPFAPTLMESTRAIGYSIETAIADVIDNSVAAGADRIDIDFFPIGESYISILDNGCGMSEDELVQAMQYGSRNPLEQRNDSDLGRYGLGMKTASLSQCRVLTVISKQKNIVSGAQWNLNHVSSTQQWTLIVLDQDEIREFPNWEKLSSYESGTIVVWQDLDKFGIGEDDMVAAFSKKMELIRDHLSLVFHRYLSGETGLKKIDIRMNNLSIKPQDPFLIKKSTLLMDEETIWVQGQAIKIKAYILPHTSKLTQKELKALGGNDGLRRRQGFYVYRNKRLLIWGDWFRLMRHGDLSKLARVQVDIPNTLDDLWTLDVKKSKAVPPAEVKKNLAVIVQKISEGSKRTWTFRGKRETSDDVVHVWNRMVGRNGIYYEVNADHPMVNALEKEFPGIKPKLGLLLKQVGLSLPLNALYIDLTSDEKLASDSDDAAKDIIALLKNMTAAEPAGDQRLSLIETLKLVEPFCAYIDEIDIAVKRGEFNDN